MPKKKLRHRKRNFLKFTIH